MRPPKEEKNVGEPAAQRPAKRKVHSAFEERNQTIRKALKEFRKPLSEAIDYSVRIEDWRCDYSFGLNPSYDPLHRDNGLSSFQEAPFSEYRDLVLSGVFLEPRKLREKKFEARLERQAYLGKKTIEENARRHEESMPKGVGGFLRQSLSILAFLAIPEDAFALVLQSAAAHKINFMTLRGQKLRYGHGTIYNYSLQEREDE